MIYLKTQLGKLAQILQSNLLLAVFKTATNNLVIADSPSLSLFNPKGGASFSRCRREFSTSTKNNQRRKYNQLGAYLAGLIEGDGNIYTPGLNVKGLPKIEITFDIKDIPLAQKIQSVIEGGKIYTRSNGQSCRIVIKKYETLLKVVQLINGYFRTPKLEALHRLIAFINSKHQTNIPFLDLDTTPLKDSSWLSGMLDADGSFYLTWKLNKKDIPIGIIYYLRLSQKQNYTRRLDPSVNVSNYTHMQEIAQLFKTLVSSRERKRDGWTERNYEIRTHKLESKLQLFDYLSNFPLFGYKYFDQIFLHKIHTLFINKEYQTQEGKAKLIQYTKLMKVEENNQASWDHLNKFYKS